MIKDIEKGDKEMKKLDDANRFNAFLRISIGIRSSMTG